ncbi:MAG: carboxypeptidase regulatory-like domain-containing protein [Pyrinomonadaceae bacterium]
MYKAALIALLPLLVFFSKGSDIFRSDAVTSPSSGDSGKLEKLIVAKGSVAMDVDLNTLAPSGRRSRAPRSGSLRFEVQPNSFFTVLVFNDELRGPLPSSMPLTAERSTSVGGRLGAGIGDLTIDNAGWGGAFELTVRDAKSGFSYFNIEGYEFSYSADDRRLLIENGRLLLSREFAAELGRPAGTSVGSINIEATMRPIEVTHIVDGEVKSDEMPAINDAALPGTVPGPDVVVGDLSGLAQFGSSAGTQVGLAVGTDSCNFGTQNLNWFANPANDHPVIPQNLYRMSGGADNTERFEQIGQSSVKHAFTALTNNLCNLGCNGVGGSQLGSGCSDPYSASLNAGPNLGSRAWINPFTGFYPRNDSATPNNNHTGHTHLGPSHRILTEISDLSTAQNPGATYYAEAQYITPHEYAWCQANPGQCNMYNNVSYRQYSVSGTTSPFSFSPAGSTQRTKPAITAWPGATSVEIRPDPNNDGIGTIAYKVTNPSPGVWHYEYAIYNQNLDRGIQSFSIPLGNGITLSNIGFHAPPQHPGWSGDGTVGNAGYSSTPWTPTQTPTSLTWASETFAQNPNANAIRWGTLYNFRFDSNRPPQVVNATIGFFKTGNPINLQVMGPTPAQAALVSVSGRVATSSGEGIGRAAVTITNGSNFTRTTYTSAFGYYRFDDIPAGASYTVSISVGRYTFTPQTRQIDDGVADLNFTAAAF